MSDAFHQHSQQDIKQQSQHSYSIQSETPNSRCPQAIKNYLKQQSKSMLEQKSVIKLKKKKTFLAKSIDYFKSKNKIQPSSLVICGICQSQISKKNMFSLGNCQHKFCQRCISSYTTYKINLFEQVYCPEQSCKQILRKTSQIYEGLPKILQLKYEKIHHYQQIKSNNQLRLCPNQHCEGVINISKALNNLIICSKCETEFCTKCWMKFHRGVCDKYQILFFQTGLNYRQCKKCRRVIERISGCDHITCKCSHQFCYICGKDWSSYHSCNSTPQCCVNNLCCRLFWKIIYILLYSTIIYPIILVRSIAAAVGLLFISVFAGIVIQPFVILGELFKKDLCCMFAGVILYPLLMIYGILRVIHEMFVDTYQVLFPSDQFCSVCIMIVEIKQIIESEQQNKQSG